MVEMYGLQREMSKGKVDRKAALAEHAESAEKNKSVSLRSLRALRRAQRRPERKLRIRCFSPSVKLPRNQMCSRRLFHAP